MRDEVPADYSDLLDTVFKKGGRGPYYYDCYGLVREMHRRATGKLLPDFKTAAQQSLNALTFKEQLREGPWVRVSCRPGAFVVMEILGHVAHIGYVLTPTKFIHILEQSKHGACVERISDWQHRIVGFYEYVGD